MARSRLCPGPRATTRTCRSRKRVSERWKVDALRQQAPLVAQVAERVLGEDLERPGHARALLRERRLELTRLERPARREAGAVAEDARAAHGDVLAVSDLVEERCAGGVDQPHASADEQQRPRVREAAALRVRHVDDHADARVQQLLGRDPVEVEVIDDRDVARAESADESFRSTPQAGRPRELDEAHAPCSAWTAAMNSSPPSMRRISSRPLGCRRGARSSCASDRRAPSRRGSAGRPGWRSAVGG